MLNRSGHSPNTLPFGAPAAAADASPLTALNLGAPAHRTLRSRIPLALSLILGLGLGLAPSCMRSEASAVAAPQQPDLRLYLMGTVAGAVEPCGCRKDMLGGIDHAAAWLQREANTAPTSLLLGAGPLFFMDPTLDASRRSQDEWKAEALAASLADLRLRAWAPGLNDYAAGVDAFRKLSERARAVALGGQPDGPRSTVLTIGTTRVGVAGLGVSPPGGSAPRSTAEAVKELTAAAEQLQHDGAQLRVALLALDRGEALRLTEQVPGFHLVVVGKPSDAGEANDAPFPPVMLGSTLVVQPPNHLQAIAHVDYFVREGRFAFADGSGLEHRDRVEALRNRVTTLDRRLQQLSKTTPEFSNFERELANLRIELAGLEQQKPGIGRDQVTESTMFYELTEIRETYGDHPAVTARLGEYYRRVNDHNREAFKDRVPPKPAAHQAGYVGQAVCGACHPAAAEVWKNTRHSKAYFSLATQHKEFNLECVSCHVTGYDKPGGSTVTHVEGLEGVQCEVCHGAGSLHAQQPKAKGLVTRTPDPTVCRGCHHSPHVDERWDVISALPHIIAPGHGLPLASAPASPPSLSPP